MSSQIKCESHPVNYTTEQTPQLDSWQASGLAPRVEATWCYNRPPGEQLEQQTDVQGNSGGRCYCVSPSHKQTHREKWSVLCEGALNEPAIVNAHSHMAMRCCLYFTLTSDALPHPS